MKKEYFNGNTNYQLLIFLLLMNGNIKSKEYLFHNKFDENILKKFKNKEIINTSFKSQSKLVKFFLQVREIKRIKKSNKFSKYKNIKIFGESIYSPIFIQKNCDLFLLEDGLGNYINYKKNNFIRRFCQQILKLFIGRPYLKYGGRSKEVKKIYLTGLALIPEEIAHKVEIINLKELWNKKTLEEQKEILDIFSFDLDIKEKIKGRDIILFTQPLSEDSVITEEEKVEIYLKIIKKYPKERLVIKIHPREKTNYKEIFKEYLILDNPFPFEILNLLDVKFSKAITIFSTAALGLGKKVKVDFYGTEVHPKILERFGSCDNIMERNCFLKEE